MTRKLDVFLGRDKIGMLEQDRIPRVERCSRSEAHGNGAVENHE